MGSVSSAPSAGALNLPRTNRRDAPSFAGALCRNGESNPDFTITKRTYSPLYDTGLCARCIRPSSDLSSRARPRRAGKRMEPPIGFEPITYCLQDSRSTPNELRWQVGFFTDDCFTPHWVPAQTHPPEDVPYVPCGRRDSNPQAFSLATKRAAFTPLPRGGVCGNRTRAYTMARCQATITSILRSGMFSRLSVSTENSSGAVPTPARSYLRSHGAWRG